MNYDDIPQSRTDDGAFILGSDDAPITIVIFEDFLCVHCQHYHKSTLTHFIEQYVATGKARLEYRDWAIHGSDSIYAYSLAGCADQHGKSFWEAHDILFEMEKDEVFTEDDAREFADRVGIAFDTLNACADDADQFRADAHLAQQANLIGTPTVTMRADDGSIDTDTLSSQPDLDELAAVVEEAQ